MANRKVYREFAWAYDNAPYTDLSFVIYPNISSASVSHLYLGDKRLKDARADPTCHYDREQFV